MSYGPALVYGIVISGLVSAWTFFKMCQALNLVVRDKSRPVKDIYIEMIPYTAALIALFGLIFLLVMLFP